MTASVGKLSRREDLSSDFVAANDALEENGWTDGLPVIPPTEELVAAMIAGDARVRLEELRKKQVAMVAPPIPTPSADPCAGAAVTVSQSPRPACPLSAAAERALKPKDSFRECDRCPEMVVVPAGSFTMGSPESERTPVAAAFVTYGIVPGGLTTAPPLSSEGPQHKVTISQPFLMGSTEVTVAQFRKFVEEAAD